MRTKQELISRMLEMQKMFIEYEHEHGVNMGDYYMPAAGHPLEGYLEEYQSLSKELVDLAHAEAGSRR